MTEVSIMDNSDIWYFVKSGNFSYITNIAVGDINHNPLT